MDPMNFLFIVWATVWELPISLLSYIVSGAGSEWLVK